MEAFRRAITSNTILLVGSAPQYCHCVIDPIPELSAIAVEKGIPLHVDACFGGFMLPWVEALGFPVTPFDFRLAGVTSMSADLHKYGFSIKGNSVLVFRDEELRRHQYFSYSGWPGGLFGSPSILGTRPGGNIATGWATLMALGREGFTNIARDCMRVTQAMIDGVNAVDGLTVLGKPPMTAFSFASTDPNVDILSVADIMEERGWRMERQQLPNCLHCSVMPSHVLSYEQFCKDVAEAVEMCRRDKSLAKKGTAGMYGMVANIPDKTIIDDFIVGYLSEMYKAT